MQLFTHTEGSEEDGESLSVITLGSSPFDLEDVLKDLLLVEEKAWGTAGPSLEASGEKIRRRVESFPEGVTLAGLPIMVAGCGCFLEPVGSQYAFRFNWNSDAGVLGSWEDKTAGGWTDKVHDPQGNTGFLVGVGVLPRFRGKRFPHTSRWGCRMRASELLIAQTLDNLFRLGVKQVIANARIPGYHALPELSVDQYCALRSEDGSPFDPVLRFHKRMGGEILKPVAYSMEDPESRNAGCWVLYSQAFVR